MTIYPPPPPAPPTFPPLTPIPSGLIIPLYSGIKPGIYLFETVSTDCIFLQSFFGAGFGKLFEGYNGLYLMGVPSGLMFSQNSVDFQPINSYASSITQIDDTHITVVFKNILGTKVQVETQSVPEHYGGWTVETIISGTVIADSAGESDAINSNTLPLLTGNAKSNTLPRIQRNIVRNHPLGNFTESDAGIPATAQITDLEAV